MPSSRPRDRIDDILTNIASIEAYTAGMNLAAFSADQKTRDAVERCLSRISEAVVKLGDLPEKMEPDQPWGNIRGYGNRLRHAYDGVDPAEVMGIVIKHLGPLKAACQRMQAEFDRGS